jgi:hypothetical protein
MKIQIDNKNGNIDNKEGLINKLNEILKNDGIKIFEISAKFYEDYENPEEKVNPIKKYYPDFFNCSFKKDWETYNDIYLELKENHKNDDSVTTTIIIKRLNMEKDAGEHIDSFLV